MKNTIKALALAVLAAGLVSCVDKPEFTTVPFVSMYRTSATVTETAGGTVYSIPLKLYNTSDSTAIVVNVTGQPGVFTGNLNMRVTLESATAGVTIGNFKSFNMTIKDVDHPLSALFGTYTMAAVSVTNNGEVVYPKWTVNVSQFDGDATKVWFDNLTYFSAVPYHSYTGNAPVFGIVSADKKTITIPLPQKTTGSLSAFGLDNIYMFAHEGAGGVYLTDNVDIVFKLNDDGAWTTEQCFGAGHPDDLADYPDLFYEYCVNYSNFNSGYPTYLKKN